MNEATSDTVKAIAAVTLLLLMFLVIVRLIARKRRAGASDASRESGFASWLLVLALGQTFLPFRLASNVFSSLSQLPELDGVDNGMLAAGLEIAVTAVLAVFSAAVAVLMWRRSPRFPRLFVAEWVLLMGFVVLDPLFYAGLTSVPLEVLYGDRDTIRSIAGNAVSVVWVAYVLRSRRVALTFIGRTAMA